MLRCPDKYVKLKEEGKSTIYLVNSIAEFVELSTWFSMDGRVIFRGQTKDLPLIPSVGRKKSFSDVLRNEEKMLRDFEREALPYLNIKPENDWQLLALAQHNGLPTRLMDWTKNPLVALWFAVKDVTTRYLPRIVWAYIYEEEEIGHCGSPFDINKPFIYFPEHIFPFIQAQSGVFTVHHKTKEKPITFPPFEIENGDLRLSKIEIPPNAVCDIRGKLAQLGVHSATMFPGLKGIINRIIFENEALDDEGRSFRLKKRYINRKHR